MTSSWISSESIKTRSSYQKLCRLHRETTSDSCVPVYWKVFELQGAWVINRQLWLVNKALRPVLRRTRTALVASCFTTWEKSLSFLRTGFWLLSYDFGGKRKPVYALEGSIAVAGSGVKFLMNNMGFITHSHKISDLAASVEDNGGCVFVTAFSGLFAPYWIDDAKGTIFGITQFTERGHIARATLEATCFQTRAILDAMELDSGHKLNMLAVDGGMSNSNLCMQTQANIIGIPVDRPAMRETTALGAAIAAGFAVDVWKEFDELKEINQKDRMVFKPNVDKEVGEKMFKKWGRAVEMCRGWLDAGEANGEFS